MAGIMDEYDPATPVGKAYCARLNAEEYEDQASMCTEDALAELIQYLGKNPASYRRVMASRKKEQEENAGFFSYAKVSFALGKVWSSKQNNLTVHIIVRAGQVTAVYLRS